MQGYCDAVMEDALFDGSQNDHHRQHEACLAPIARGLVRKCVCACVRTRACACACDCVAVMLAADTCTYCTVDATLHTTKVMFAAGPAEAEAAFKNAVEHRSTTSGLQVLTWTTRWQMPDRHVPGLRAQMWWPELEAVEVLRANSAMLSREFALLLAEGEGGPDHIVNKFNRRRADSWIPVPRDGWGMVQLESCCTVAAATCDLVRKIRGGCFSL